MKEMKAVVNYAREALNLFDSGRMAALEALILRMIGLKNQSQDLSKKIWLLRMKKEMKLNNMMEKLALRKKSIRTTHLWSEGEDDSYSEDDDVLESVDSEDCKGLKGGDGNRGNRIGDCKGDGRGPRKVLDEMPKPISYEIKHESSEMLIPLLFGCR
ncbi:hypothetical protein U1Q18_017946 [Sarracenia purpurea var. burkii]